MKSEPERLLEKHAPLVHSDMQRVTSHTQRKNGDWIINTILLEGHEVPFRYKRKQQYKNLTGARVNVTYYAATHTVAGIVMEVMNVVRILRS